jgi:hypothetical protein
MRFFILFLVVAFGTVSFSGCDFLMPKKSARLEPLAQSQERGEKAKALSESSPRLFISGLVEEDKGVTLEKELEGDPKKRAFRSTTPLTLFNEDSNHVLEFRFATNGQEERQGLPTRVSARESTEASVPKLFLVTAGQNFQLSMEKVSTGNGIRVKGLGSYFSVSPDSEATLEIEGVFRDGEGRAIRVELPVRRRPTSLEVTAIPTKSVSKQFLYLKQGNQIYALIQAFRFQNQEKHGVEISLPSRFTGKLSAFFKEEVLRPVDACRVDVKEVTEELLYSKTFIIRPLDQYFIEGGPLVLNPLGTGDFGVYSKDPFAVDFAKGDGQWPKPQTVNMVSGCKRECVECKEPRYREVREIFPEEVSERTSSCVCLRWENRPIIEPRRLAITPLGVELYFGADRLRAMARYSDQSVSEDPILRSFRFPQPWASVEAKAHDE